MNTTNIGFIGGGRIVRILLAGWNHAQSFPAAVVVADPNTTALLQLKEQFPTIETTADTSLAAAQDVVFLATHPPAVAEAAARAAPSLRPNAILVSLAPKFTLAKLTGLLGGFGRIARVIPNAPSVVGYGFNPVAYGPALRAADRALIAGILAPLGESPEVTEEKLEAFALITGMGPTYLWFQLQALRDAAVGFGLSPRESGEAVKRMACGAVRTLVESGLSPAEVMDLVPVKPLAEMEPQVLEFYRTRLPALLQKLKP